jgi:hypothetical protein
MDMAEQNGSQASEAPITPESPEQKLEREKTELLSKISENSLTDIKAKVAFILNHYPNTRNDDLALAIQFWKIFNRDIIGESHVIAIKDIYKLNRINSIIRARAKIQNTYGLFLASEKIRRRRAELDDEERERQVEDQPDNPLISIFCDESGKTDEHLIVGSVWINDAYAVYKNLLSACFLKKEMEIDYEFHFSHMTRHKTQKALEFVRKAMSESSALGFKAAVVRRRDVGSQTSDEAIYRLHYQLVVQGMEHEVSSARVSLPRILSVTKDRDDGSDRLRLAELAQKLKRECKEHFSERVEIQSVDVEDSSASVYLQLSDLFTSSVARVLNCDASSARNHKDEFAESVLTLLGINLAVDATRQDFVEIIRI